MSSTKKPSEPLVSFIVPAYNESDYIDQVLDKVYGLGLNTEVIAVDDGSEDGTWDKLKEWESSNGLIAIQHQHNMGKGAAIRNGITRSAGDIVVIQDADMEYDPSDVSRLIAPIIDGHADVVYGSRLSGGQPQRAYMFWHLVGNKFLTLITNVLYNTTLSDMETGYKAFRGEIIRDIKLVSNDFTIEPEITSKVLRRKLRIYEVPVAYYGRDYAEGKNITWRDGFPAVWALIRFRITK